MPTDSVQTNGTEHTPLSGQELVDQISDLVFGEVTSKYARLLFVGQAWINGKAMNRDDERYAYCVPLVDLHSEDGWRIERLDELHHPHHVTDDLRHHKNAPPAVKEYRGPFKIKVAAVGIEQSAIQVDDSDPYTPCPACGSREGYSWSESLAATGDIHTEGSGRPMPEAERHTNVHSKGTPTCSGCGEVIPLREFTE